MAQPAVPHSLLALTLGGLALACAAMDAWADKIPFALSSIEVVAVAPPAAGAAGSAPRARWMSLASVTNAASSPAASTPDTTQHAASPAKKPKRVYFGGGVSVSMGTQTRVSITPLLGYRISPAFSAGTEFTYEYWREEFDNQQVSTQSYGASVFGRYHPTPKLYAHIEPAVYQQEVARKERVPGSSVTKTRYTVPYLFIGGGAFQPISPGLQAFVQITIDVLRDPHSPYRGGEAFVTTGITADL